MEACATNGLHVSRDARYCYCTVKSHVKDLRDYVRTCLRVMHVLLQLLQQRQPASNVTVRIVLLLTFLAFAAAKAYCFR